MEYRSRNVLLATFVAIALVAVASHARTWNVRPDASGDAPTIQAAMDSAASGDLVLLAPGTYTWTSQNASGTSMVRIARDVVLRGTSGAAASVLDAEQQGRVILVTSGVTAELEGLTLARGRVMDYPAFGGGIRAEAGSELRIAHCIIRDNIALLDEGVGGGMACDKATITDCEISNNFSTDGAGVWGASITLSNCSLRGNVAGGHSTGSGAGVWAKTGTLTDCWFEDNRAGPRSHNSGGGVLFKEDGSIARCAFVNNSAVAHDTALGGAVVCEAACTIDASIFVGNAVDAASGVGGTIAGYGGVVTVTGCTLVGNRCRSPGDFRPPIGGIAIAQGSVSRCIIVGSEGLAVGRSLGGCEGGPVVSLCDLFGNSGGDGFCGVDRGDNFSADAEFCAVDPAASLLFTLQTDSPCATRFAPLVIGAGPVGCGSVSVQQRSWSAVKSLYRGTHRRVEP